MMNSRRDWLIRILIGGMAGWAVLFLIGYVAGSFSLFGPSSFRGFHFVDGTMERLFGSEALAVVVQFILFFTLGALAGIATLPFADSGRELLLRSLLHFAVTEAVVCIGVLVNFAGYESPLPWMAGVAVLYAVIWLGRWAGWYAEVAQIREKLGIGPAPSPLKWRETLPHIAFAVVLCLGVPLVLMPFDAPDVPVLIALLYTFLLLPVGAFCSGLSLGRRQGVCPLYPLACGGLTLLFLLLLQLRFHRGFEPRLFWLSLCFSLMGNLLGAGMKAQRKETA